MDTVLMPLVEGYLSGDVALERLQKLLIDITWENPKKTPRDTMDLAKRIELCIAEYTGGYITELNLKSDIRDLLGIKILVVNESSSSAPFLWGSVATTQKRSMAYG
jgi:hypothetical protein